MVIEFLEYVRGQQKAFSDVRNREENLKGNAWGKMTRRWFCFDWRHRSHSQRFSVR